MKLLTALLLLLLACSYQLAHSQNSDGNIWDNTSFLIRGKLGANIYMVPQDVNVVSTENGATGLNETYGVTLGAVARAEVYPIFSPFLSYGYFAEYSLGALINTTHSYLEHGHRLFVGFHPVMLGGEISYLPFRNMVKYGIKQNETSKTTRSATSKYAGLWRYSGLVRIVIKHKHFIDAGYFREYYPEPNGTTQAYNGIKLNYWKFNGIDLGFEFSWDLYPIKNSNVSLAQRPEDPRTKAFYFNLTISKSFDLFGRPFHKWFH